MFNVGDKAWYLDIYDDVYTAIVLEIKAGKYLIKALETQLPAQLIPIDELYSFKDKLARLLYA